MKEKKENNKNNCQLFLGRDIEVGRSEEYGHRRDAMLASVNTRICQFRFYPNI